MTWQFTLTGLLIGVLVGLTGMGGGALLTPILVLLFGFKPTYAVGTDILHGAVFKSFGALRHRRLGTVHARLTFWMFLGSGVMSLLGVVVASRLEDAYGEGVQSAEPTPSEPRSFSAPPVSWRRRSSSAGFSRATRRSSSNARIGSGRF
jgi:uncharacterized membrane protein YfcA